MAMNRIQFQPVVSMAEFMRRHRSDELFEACLVAARWRQGFVRPDCGCAVHSSFNRPGRLYWQCSACRYLCSITAGTIFKSSKLHLSTWFMAMHLMMPSKNFIYALELKRHLGVCYKTAGLVKHKLMQAM